MKEKSADSRISSVIPSSGFTFFVYFILYYGVCTFERGAVKRKYSQIN
jgi:hypothetical protein